MRSWISATSSFASVVMIAKVRNHSPETGSFQFSPNSTKRERITVLHRDGIGLLRRLALDRLPFEEAIDRKDAAAPAVGLAECRQRADGLAPCSSVSPSHT